MGGSARSVDRTGGRGDDRNERAGDRRPAPAPAPAPAGHLTMVVGLVVEWWREWLSTGPRTTGPGPVEGWYRAVRAWLGQHATLADAALASAVAVGAVPQLVYHARHPGGQFGACLVFTALLV